jgi:hypothetical protein
MVTISGPNYYAVDVCRRKGGVSPRPLNLGTRWKVVVRCLAYSYFTESKLFLLPIDSETE